MVLEKFYESFPDITAEVEGVARAGGAHQGADFDGPFAGIGDLQDLDAFIPQRVLVQ